MILRSSAVVAVVLAAATTQAAPTARIVFASASDLEDNAKNAVHPLACYNPTTATIQKGADCLALLPQRAWVFGADKERVRTGKRALVECTTQVTALVVNRAPPSLVEWPSYSLRPPKRQRDATAFERRELASQVHHGDALRDVKVTILDLDGDGEPEKILSANVGTDKDSWGYGVIALWRGKRLTVLERSERGSIELVQVFDLDGDGLPELVLSRSHWDAGGNSTIERIVGDKLELLSVNEYCNPC